MICTQFLHTFVLFRYMETVNFEKTTVLCTFCLPHKNKKRPRRDAFCFATRILPQAFFVQAVCYKCFSYKNFATSIFRTSGLLQVFLQAKVLLQVWLYKCFTYKSFAKYQASPKLFLQRRCFHTRQVLSVARRTFRVLMPCNNISRKVGNGFLCARVCRDWQKVRNTFAMQVLRCCSTLFFFMVALLICTFIATLCH